MSYLFQYEKNIEKEVASFFSAQGLKAFATKGLDDLEGNNVQVALEYQGALESHRQVYEGFQEYDLHVGTLIIQISTFRDEENVHHDRVGLARKLMLNGKNGFESNLYTVFDLMPENASHQQFTENNLDQSTLSYSIKWKVDLTKLNN